MYRSWRRDPEQTLFMLAAMIYIVLLPPPDRQSSFLHTYYLWQHSPDQSLAYTWFSQRKWRVRASLARDFACCTRHAGKEEQPTSPSI